MDNLPIVSVVVTSYNTKKYIIEALDSVFGQDYQNLEVIVVDDGSTDNTMEVLKYYPRKIKIIEEENKGQAFARNTGIKEARGEFIGLLDGDDMWTEYHISLGLKYLKDNQEYDFVRGKTRRFNVKDDGTKEIVESAFIDMLVGASFYRSKIFEKVGLFDEEMREGEDLDWFIRLAESSCREKRIEETMLLYRRHQNNLTNSREFITRGQLNAYRKKIARRKLNSNN